MQVKKMHSFVIVVHTRDCTSVGSNAVVFLEEPTAIRDSAALVRDGSETLPVSVVLSSFSQGTPRNKTARPTPLSEGTHQSVWRRGAYVHACK
jgi:hypothetical protein